MEVSISRGRRFVKGIGLGRTKVAGGRASVAGAQRAQYGFWVRPSNGLGSWERLPLGVRGSGSAGVTGAFTPGLGRVRCNMIKSPINAIG
jgi:hypothetical protein